MLGLMGKPVYGWVVKGLNLCVTEIFEGVVSHLSLQDATCYEKAWELSGHHNSRAQRSLGYLHLRAKEVDT